MPQKTKTKSKSKSSNPQTARLRRRFQPETDGQYLLKLVVVTLLGTFWVKFASPLAIGDILLGGLPLGLLAGLLLVNRAETNQSDRKIWYVVLILVTIISYFVPAGIVI